MDLLGREGIEPHRVTFVAKRPRRQYLEIYHRVDIGLDTFPYTGQTTSLDAFWLGVPVITITGQTAVGAGGAVSAQESRPAGTDCRNTRAIRGHRRGAGRRLAAVGGAPRRPAGADARFSLDGRPAFRPKRRGCLPQYVEAVVFLARIFRQFVP